MLASTDTANDNRQSANESSHLVAECRVPKGPGLALRTDYDIVMGLNSNIFMKFCYQLMSEQKVNMIRMMPQCVIAILCLRKIRYKK